MILALLAACHPGFEHVSLEGYDNPFGPDDPLWSEQPRRSKPTEVTALGDTAFVSLPGTNDKPDCHIAVVDLDKGEVTEKVEVGRSPVGVALTPDGDRLLVLNRFSNWASVIDTDTHEVVDEVQTDFYAMEAAFAPDGSVWVTNRWKDAVQLWDADLQYVTSVPVGVNPRDVAVSPDGRWVAVAAMTGLTVSIIDTATREEAYRVDLGAPANGVAFAGDWLIVPTLSASTHNLPFDGPDGDKDGQPGDGTPNVNFQDLQNEIAVLDPASGEIAHRYTSDTICCKDYRDVDPDDLDRYGDLLPPREDWIVGGALPEQVAVDGTDVWITYSASDQLQRFTLDPATGALAPGEILDTGHNPNGVAVAGDRVLVAQRLGETLGVFRGGERTDIDAGDLSGGPFPATDAEIGELFNNVTAPFTVDGDQACVACHRDGGGNIDKAVGMPLARYPGVNRRMVMAYRGAADTRPWFFETSMDQTNFRPVINEFARVENFCCEDYTLFPNGAPADCATNPPPECFSEPNADSADGFGVTRGIATPHARPTDSVTRNAFFLAQAQNVIGRTTTFGDGVYYEDPITGERAPIDLDLEGITRSLGLFLLTDTSFLPNPNNPDDPAALRGQAIFESPAAACSSCHPAPTYAVSTDNNPSNMSLQLPPVVTPDRRDDGMNIDLLSDGFIATFPTSDQDTCAEVCGEEVCTADPYACDDIRNVRFGTPQLRGIWDRAPSMLHDGRAKGLREVLCTPGHEALQPGEIGYNERDGIPDTHGATSQLSAAEIADLIAYLETL